MAFHSNREALADGSGNILPPTSSMTKHSSSPPARASSVKLVRKLNELNNRYRLGLRLENDASNHQMPSWVKIEEHYLWRDINQQIAKWHAVPDGTTRVYAALSTYKSWAKGKRVDVGWAPKEHADPRTLGIPHSHIVQLKRCFEVSEFSSSRYKKRKSREISGSRSIDMMPVDDVQYPEFTHEARGEAYTWPTNHSELTGADAISRSESGRLIQVSARRASNQQSSRPILQQVPSSATVASQAEGSQYKKRAKKSACQDQRGHRGSQPIISNLPSTLPNAAPMVTSKLPATVQLSTSAATSPNVSFNGSFLKASFGPDAPLIETPATSFGSEMPGTSSSMGLPASRKAGQPNIREHPARPIKIPKRSQPVTIQPVSHSSRHSQSDYPITSSNEDAFNDLMTPALVPEPYGQEAYPTSEHGATLSQASCDTDTIMFGLDRAAAQSRPTAFKSTPELTTQTQSTLIGGTPPASAQTMVGTQTFGAKLRTKFPVREHRSSHQIRDPQLPSSVPLRSSSDDRAMSPPDVPTPSLVSQASSILRAKRSKLGEQEKELFVDKASPFANMPVNDTDVHSYRALFEMTRVAMQRNSAPTRSVDQSPTQALSMLFPGIKDPDNDGYASFWDTLLDRRGVNSSLLERSSLTAWKTATADSVTSTYGGKLRLTVKNDRLVPELSLSPLKTDKSYRASRKFGADRFFVLDLPRIREIGGFKEKFDNWITDTPHYFLGRCWRPIWQRPLKNAAADFVCQVIFFATEGFDIPDSKISIDKVSPRLKSKVTDRGFLEWGLNPNGNENQPALKFFSRIGLLFTKTTPSFVFALNQIVRCQDAWSCCPGRRALRSDSHSAIHHKHSGNIMNDGCARISYDAAREVRRILGLAELPCAFQGRIGGAKGVWLVDYSEERLENDDENGDRFWIEVTDSQHKFDAYTGREHVEDYHRTFEVHSHSHALPPSCLSYRLMPIMINAGVPESTFIQLQKEDLEASEDRLFDALNSGGPKLLDWLQTTMPVTGERAAYGDIRMEGGFPDSSSEKLMMLTASGHRPLVDRISLETSLDIQKLRWAQGDNRPEMALASSTNVLMVPDPLGVLEEDEVFLQFSRPFEAGAAGVVVQNFTDRDLLVTRQPAYLPSDIRKVHGVFKHELCRYMDVIIFSIRGTSSLAELLSGGDFDGDKAWVCWEPRLVDQFRNTPVTTIPPYEAYGITKDKQATQDLMKVSEGRGLLRKGITFNMRAGMLGICSNWYMAYTYQQSSINQAKSIQVGSLLGYLVDTAKNGYTFTNTEWDAFLKENNLPSQPTKPAWLRKDATKRDAKADCIMDKLRFSIVAKHREATETYLASLQNNLGTYDGGLAKIFRDTLEMAEASDVAERERALILDEHERKHLDLLFRKLEKKSIAQEVLDIQRHLKQHFVPLFARYAQAVRKPSNSQPGWLGVKPVAEEKAKKRRAIHDLRSSFLAIEPPVSSNYHAAKTWRHEARYMLLDLNSDDWSERTARRRGLPGNDWPAEERTIIDAHFGSWTRFKASVLALEFTRHPRFIYMLAGKELCDIKAVLTRQPKEVYPVTREVYASLKIDKRFVKRTISKVPQTAVDDDDNDDIESQFELMHSSQDSL